MRRALRALAAATLVLAGLALWAVLPKGADDPLPAMASDPLPPGHGDPVSIVVLGTSLSAGTDWPEALQNSLETRLSDCSGQAVTLSVIAAGGRTSAWGQTQIDQVLAADPDMVLMEFTINDADLRRRISPAESQAHHRAILDRLRADRPATRIVLLRLGRAHGLRAALRPRQARYDAALPALAAGDAQVGLVDLRADWTALWRDQGRTALPDGLHPTAAAARQVNVAPLVQALTPVIDATCQG